MNDRLESYRDTLCHSRMDGAVVQIPATVVPKWPPPPNTTARSRSSKHWIETARQLISTSLADLGFEQAGVVGNAVDDIGATSEQMQTNSRVVRLAVRHY